MTIAIKMCGITNSADAHNAITAGADYLGFIFVPSSARVITESSASEIIPALKMNAKTVAVFKDSPLEEVNRISKTLKVDYVQLHGSESPQFCRDVEAPVIKAVQINPDANSAHLQTLIRQYADCAFILFDKPKGCDFADWLEFALTKVEALDICTNYFFAGGLQNTNVRQVLERIKPYGLDVASGVEFAPGSKDMTKMIAFCDAVRDSSQVPNEAVS